MSLSGIFSRIRPVYWVGKSGKSLNYEPYRLRHSSRVELTGWFHSQELEKNTAEASSELLTVETCKRLSSTSLLTPSHLGTAEFRENTHYELRGANRTYYNWALLYHKARKTIIQFLLLWIITEK